MSVRTIRLSPVRYPRHHRSFTCTLDSLGANGHVNRFISVQSCSIYFRHVVHIKTKIRERNIRNIVILLVILAYEIVIAVTSQRIYRPGKQRVDIIVASILPLGYTNSRYNRTLTFTSLCLPQSIVLFSTFPIHHPFTLSL